MRALRPASVAVGLALALTACSASGESAPVPTAARTSDDATTSDEAAASSDEAAASSDDGLLGTASRNGRLCDHATTAVVEAAAGGTAQSPRQMVVSDYENAWVCEVLVGGPGAQEPVLRLSILVGQEARAQARERAEAAAGVEEGPRHLGLSFVSPGLVTGLSSCTAPGMTDRAEQIPYTLVAESLRATDETTTQELLATLTAAAHSLDRALGCRPGRARDQQSAATTAP